LFLGRQFFSASPIDGVAFASSLVILPSFPVPLTAVDAIFFHLKFFLQLEMVFLKHVAELKAVGAGAEPFAWRFSNRSG
jgi:hypothetical protein